MKTVIRHGVFETNSSSTHSIAIDTRDYSPVTPHMDNGVLSATCGEFGWEQCVYTDFDTKLSYLLTWVFREYDKEISEDVYRDNDCFQEIERVLKENIAGFDKLVVNSTGDNYYAYGYIDHQSCPETPMDGMENIKDFLFNPKSILVTDNDNH